MSFTPGPWRVVVEEIDKDDPGINIEEGQDAGYTVATAWGGGDAMNAAMPHNARLIAAAPEMLQLLKDALAGELGITSRAHALITKIEGKDTTS